MKLNNFLYKKEKRKKNIFSLIKEGMEKSLKTKSITDFIKEEAKKMDKENK